MDHQKFGHQRGSMGFVQGGKNHHQTLVPLQKTMFFKFGVFLDLETRFVSRKGRHVLACETRFGGLVWTDDCE